MRAVVQRVWEAKVLVGPDTVAEIGKGLLVYLGVAKGDGDKDAGYVADKLSNLRIFADSAGKMNLSVQDVGGSVLLVSNFTLLGDCRKGRRPGFDEAGGPAAAEALYEKVAELMAAENIIVAKGIFGAYMHVSSINDGPVTFLLDSSRLF